MGLEFGLLMLLLLPLAFLPTILALKNNHPYKVAIILINILGGLFWGLGWLVALVWCFITPNKNTAMDTAAEIEKLHTLKEKGVLTQDEFDSKKKTLLDL